MPSHPEGVSAPQALFRGQAGLAIIPPLGAILCPIWQRPGPCGGSACGTEEYIQTPSAGCDAQNYARATSHSGLLSCPALWQPQPHANTAPAPSSPLPSSMALHQQPSLPAPTVLSPPGLVLPGSTGPYPKLNKVGLSPPTLFGPRLKCKFHEAGGSAQLGFSAVTSPGTVNTMNKAGHRTPRTL